MNNNVGSNFIMKEERFTVHYLSVKDGYLYFSDHWSKRLCHLNSTTSALRVDYQNGKQAYFSWSTQCLNKNDDSIVRVSATYAQKLGIRNGEDVHITFHDHVPSVTRVYVSPVSQDDFEILALNQEHLQSGLLDQLHVIWPGQVFVAWVGTSMHAVVRVDDLEPKGKVGRLEMLTEIIVNPPPYKEVQNPATEILNIENGNENENGEVESYITASVIRSADDVELQKTTSVVTLIWDSIQGISSKLLGIEDKCDKTSSTTTLGYEKLSNKFSKPVVYRVHPLEIADDNNAHPSLLQPFNLFVRKKHLPYPFINSETELIAKLEGVLLLEKSGLSQTDEEKGTSKREEKCKPSPNVYVKLCVIEDVIESLPYKTSSEINTIFQDVGQKCVYLSKVVQAALQVKTGGRVRMEIHINPLKLEPVEVQLTPAVPVGVHSISLENVWKSYMKKLCEGGEVLITSNTMIPLCSPSFTVYHTQVTLRDPLIPYGFFSNKSLDKCKVHVLLAGGNYVAIPTVHDNKLHYKEEYHCFRHLQKLIDDGITDLEMTLHLGQFQRFLEQSITSVVNILITGKHGSGVSTLAKHICGTLNSPPWYVYCAEINCRNLKGKKVEILQNIMAEALAECNLHQPAILLLHDLDVLVASPNQDQEMSSTENLFYMRVGKVVVELLEEYQPQHQIAVVATADSSSKLTSSLMAPRGQHTFLSLLEVPDLTKDDRYHILKMLLKKKVCLSYDDKLLNELKIYAQKSDGFVVQDLVDFMEKAVFEAWKRTGLPDPLPNIVSEDLKKAFLLTQPLGLRGVNLVKNSSLSWEDIGGLEDAKKLLVEMLEWPVQFPELYARAPLRLQSGLLLYGAPGTGKTLLAGAVAKECGLNFISVKGPELLSKYIGASEEAVRTIFQKAQSAKPCVLFFDEFDSLAPRRGHDSTGVTDRVVNQLLTQLDGVESLNGVWILAASSRPDLLDPALLRPGRLDRTILCPLPSEGDRLSILKSLSRRMTLACDVDLPALAKKSSGFTGADLQAVLFTAQLMAMEDIGDGDKMNGDDLLEDISPMLKTVHTPESEFSSIPILVNDSHLQKAFKDTRPSLSLQERQKYADIYDYFEKSHGNPALNVLNQSMLKQKVTLA